MKLLLITFPVDLGSATYEQRFVSFFSNCDRIDLNIFQFAPSSNTPHPNSIFSLEYARMLLKRGKDSVRLWQAVDLAKRQDRKILIMGVSPAMFAYLASGKNNSYIVTDWTRKLYEPIWGFSGSPEWLTIIHEKILNAQISVLALTRFVSEEIAKDYHVPLHKIKRVKVPFSVDLELFTPIVQREDDEIRLLFVGRDFQRKGGDVLLKWFKQNHLPNLTMTMLTDVSIEKHRGITIDNNVQYGQQQHIDLFVSHDIFVLPTTCDAYPSVLGEAACAGLCILTTSKALGAPEVIKPGVNGYILDSQAELLACLTELIKDKQKIKSMKKNSRKLMETEFSQEKVMNEYLDYLSETITYN